MVRGRAPWAVLAWAAPTLALAGPTGGNVVAGSATITTPDAATTNINQGSQRAIINWQSFSIGGSEHVQFIQPNSTAIALNRVVGVQPSSILGTLTANGRVFLVNPNGVMFGPGATLDVGGLVASVLDISNQDFLAGNYVFHQVPGAPTDAKVINEGVIKAREKGFVVLAGNYTENSGIVQARLGQVVLASGSQMTLDLNGDGLVNFSVDSAALTSLAGVSNTGALMADGGRVIMTAKVASDLVATAVNNAGTVQATGVAESGGQIYLTGDGGDVVNSGTVVADTANGQTGSVVVHSTHDVILESGSKISASGAPGGVNDGGDVRLLADGTLNVKQGSQVSVDGGPDGGNGGFLELSGDTVKLRGVVSGRALAPGYKSGSLLLDPQNITLVGSGGVNLNSYGSNAGSTHFASATGSGTLFINKNMSGGAWTNVTLHATNDLNVGRGASYAGTDNLVNSDMPTNGALTLIADHNVNVRNDIGSSGSRFNHDLTLQANNDVNVRASIWLGNNALNMHADNDHSGGGNVNIGPSGNTAVDVNTKGPIDISGANVTIAGNSQAAVRVIADDGNAATTTDKITITATGDVLIRGGDYAGAFSSSRDVSATVQAGADISINAGGNATVRGGNFADAFASEGSSAMLNASARLAAGRDLVINAQNVTVSGGYSALALASYSAGASVDASAEMTAGRNATLTLTGGVNVLGGSSARAVAYGASASAHVNAGARLTAGNDVSVTANYALVYGGSSAAAVAAYGYYEPAYFSEANVDASALVHAGHDVTLHLSGGLGVYGGWGGSAVGGGSFSSASLGSSNAAHVNASAAVTAGHDIGISASSVGVDGGFFEHAEARGYGNTAHLDASAMLTAGHNLTLDTSYSVNVGGGPFVSAYASGGGSAVANAGATVSVGNDLTMNGESLYVFGGYAGGALASGYSAHAEVDTPASVTVGHDVSLTLSGDLVVGGSYSARASAFGPYAGAQVDASARLTAGNDLTATASYMYVAGGGLAYAFAGNASSGENASADASALLHAGHDATLTTGVLGVYGGYGGIASQVDGSGGIATANASATVSAGNDVRVTGASLTVAGGSSGSVAAWTFGKATVDQSAALTAGHDATLTLDGGLSVHGGSGGFALASGYGASVSVDASARVTAGHDMAVRAAYASVQAGGEALASVDYSSHSYARVNTSARVSGGNNVNLNLGSTGALLVTGGSSLRAYEGYASGSASVNGSARVSAGGNLSVTAGNVIVAGGSSAYASAYAPGAHAQVDASGRLTAGQNATLNVTGSVGVYGGFASASAFSGSGAAVARANANADALIQTGGGLTITGPGSHAAALHVHTGSSYAGSSPSASATADARARIIANALAVRTSGVIDAGSGSIVVGNGNASGIPFGDPGLPGGFLAAGLPFPNRVANAAFVSASSDPNALTLGQFTMTGSYLWLQADHINFTTSPLNVPHTVVAQMLPFTPGGSMGIEQSVNGTCGSTCLLNLTATGNFDFFPGTTIIAGATTYTGDVTLGENGPIDLGTKNFFVLTRGTITGFDNVITTGFSGTLVPVASTLIPVPSEFEPGSGEDGRTDPHTYYIQLFEGGVPAGFIQIEDGGVNTEQEGS